MKNFREKIAEQLQKAEHSIQIAVGLFTDVFLIDKLICQARRGVRVEVILSLDEWNLIRFFDYHKLRIAGGLVRVFGSSGLQEMDFMNANCCIIDGILTVEGPPDFTRNHMALAGELRVDRNLAWAGELQSEFEELMSGSSDYFTYYQKPRNIASKLLFLEQKGLSPRDYYLAKVDPSIRSTLAILEM